MQYINPVGAQGPANDFGNNYVDKNAGAGIAGSFLAADAAEHPQIEILKAIVAGGLTPSGGNLSQLAQAIQSGKSTYAVATGTANAWIVAPNLAVPAYASGRALNIIAPATNTSTTVTMDVSTLGTRRIKKSDGTDPAIGDLVSGRIYPTIDDGASIRVLTPLPSEMLLPPPGSSTQFAPRQRLIEATQTSNQSIANSVQTILNYQTTNQNQLNSSTWSGTRLTIGAGEAGYWDIQASWTFYTTLQDAFAAVRIVKNGSTIVGEGDITRTDTSGGVVLQTNTRLKLAVGDYVEASAYHQATGGAGATADVRSRFIASLGSAY